jgi:hypothetical protein
MFWRGGSIIRVLSLFAEILEPKSRVKRGIIVCFYDKEIVLAIPIDRWESYEERSVHGPWFIVTREVKNEFLENKKLLFVAVGFVLVPNTQT